MIAWESALAMQSGLSGSCDQHRVHRDDRRGLYVLADAGPSACEGDNAAALALEAFVESLDDAPDSLLDAEHGEASLRRGFDDANAALFGTGCFSPWFNPQTAWMTVLVVRDRWAVVGRVGAHRVVRVQDRQATELHCGRSSAPGCLGSARGPLCAVMTLASDRDDIFVLSNDGVGIESMAPDLFDDSEDGGTDAAPHALIAAARWRGASGPLTAVVVRRAAHGIFMNHLPPGAREWLRGRRRPA